MMRFALLVVSGLGLASTGCIFSRMFYYATPTLAAPEYFDSRAVALSKTPVPLSPADHELVPKLTTEERDRWETFDALLESNKTRSLLIIKDDRVVYERYFDKVTRTTRLPAFSISKTYAALLVGCAVDDGLLPSIDEKLVSFIPELRKRSGYNDVTLDHLLRMTSGIDFVEESVAGAMFYYSFDLPARLYDYDIKWKPGTHYLYGSINTQLLWDVLHRKLGGRTVASYFEQRVWSRLGASDEGAWSLDSNESGTEKLFGGFSATTRDQARIGLLYMHGGSFAGEQVVPRTWIENSLSPDPVAGIVETTDGWVKRGKYQWFLTLDGRAAFAKGYHGQYIFMVPKKNMLFVRFGEGYGQVDWPALFLRIAEQ
jgi:CubicO group peptidase (beta-lactamase class C family)